MRQLRAEARAFVGRRMTRPPSRNFLDWIGIGDERVIGKARGVLRDPGERELLARPWVDHGGWISYRLLSADKKPVPGPG
jgi:hypothetical protein